MRSALLVLLIGTGLLAPATGWGQPPPVGSGPLIRNYGPTEWPYAWPDGRGGYTWGWDRGGSYEHWQHGYGFPWRSDYRLEFLDGPPLMPGGPPPWMFGPRPNLQPAPQPQFPAEPPFEPFQEEVAPPPLPGAERPADPPAAAPAAVPPPPLKPSTPQGRLESRTEQAHGDLALQREEYAQAYRRYQAAIRAAEDRAEPYFRLALTLAAMEHHRQAVAQIKRGLQLDPTWPATGAPLERFFDRPTRLALLRGATLWVRQDVRDPDRLFLLGVLLHFDGQPGQAREFFTEASQLAGGGEHLRAFLQPAPAVAPGEAR